MATQTRPRLVPIQEAILAAWMQMTEAEQEAQLLELEQNGYRGHELEQIRTILAVTEQPEIRVRISHIESCVNCRYIGMFED